MCSGVTAGSGSGRAANAAFSASRSAAISACSERSAASTPSSRRNRASARFARAARACASAAEPSRQPFSRQRSSAAESVVERSRNAVAGALRPGSSIVRSRSLTLRPATCARQQAGAARRIDLLDLRPTCAGRAAPRRWPAARRRWRRHTPAKLAGADAELLHQLGCQCGRGSWRAADARGGPAPRHGTAPCRRRHCSRPVPASSTGIGSEAPRAVCEFIRWSRSPPRLQVASAWSSHGSKAQVKIRPLVGHVVELPHARALERFFFKPTGPDDPAALRVSFPPHTPQCQPGRRNLGA